MLSAPFIFHMHRHIMFVNYMPFLIMALMGVDNLFNKNTKTLLIISIFLMIMTSYYYSVGGIIVIGIYFIYSYFKIMSVASVLKKVRSFNICHKLLNFNFQ